MHCDDVPQCIALQSTTTNLSSLQAIVEGKRKIFTIIRRRTIDDELKRRKKKDDEGFVIVLLKNIKRKEAEVECSRA